MSLWVRYATQGKPDRLGNTQLTWSDPQKLDECLFTYSAPENIEILGSQGIKVDATAYIRLDPQVSLRDAKISPDNKTWLDVIGDPHPIPPQMMPRYFPWDTQILLKQVSA